MNPWKLFLKSAKREPPASKPLTHPPPPVPLYRINQIKSVASALEDLLLVERAFSEEGSYDPCLCRRTW